MTFNISDVAVSCSRASSNSRVSRAVSVSRPTMGNPRRPEAFGADGLRRRVLTVPLPALERRFIAPPEAQEGIVSTQSSIPKGAGHETANVRFGSKADICSAKRHVRFAPNSGRVQCTSGCPLCAKSGHCALFDHLVGAREHRVRHTIPSI